MRAGALDTAETQDIHFVPKSRAIQRRQSTAVSFQVGSVLLTHRSSSNVQSSQLQLFHQKNHFVSVITWAFH
eukprot:591439-Pelagomonas_calceolata.AAC.2